MPKKKRKSAVPFYAHQTGPSRAAEQSASLKEGGGQIKALLEQISRVKAAYPVTIQPQASGKSPMIVAGQARCLLYSDYAPDRAVEKMLQDVPEDVELLVCFGAGNGDVLIEAGRRFSKLQRLYLIEPSIQILKSLLRARSRISQIAAINGLTLLYNRAPDEAASSVNEALTQQLKQKVGFAFQLPYRSLFPGYYELLQKRILEHLRNLHSGILTVEDNIHYKNRNIIHNLAVGGVSIDSVLSRFRGRPAIMISAGPSLNKNMHLLEAAKKKALVVAVGSAITILFNNRILPHVRSAFSPYPNEINVFKGVRGEDGIPLFFSNTLDYLVVRDYHGPKVRMVQEGDVISRFVYGGAGIAHSLVGGGGTIANVTFDLLARAGCSKVILMGQDLCYSQSRLYADGSWSNPVVSHEGAHMIPTVDIYGEPVYTSKGFMNIKVNFEGLIRAHQKSGVAFYNATEGGLHLEGIPDHPLQEVLDGIEREEDFEGILQDALKEEEGNWKRESVIEQMRGISSDLERIMALNAERKEALRSILSDESAPPATTLKRLQESEGYEKKLQAIPFYSRVVLSELQQFFFSIQTSHRYEGDDIEKKCESLSNIQIGYTLRLDEYARFFHETLQNALASLV